MSDVYQQLWDEDLRGNGVRALKQDAEVSEADKKTGYVLVDERREVRRDDKVLAEVGIPEEKLASYQRVEKLFDNYTLDQRHPEYDDDQEREEVQTFMNHLVETPVMKLAHQIVQDGMRRRITEHEWWAMVYQIWFERFDMGANRDLSGFEHVIVGEQKQAKVQGYHFWYKYYLDESFRFQPGDGSPDIELDAIAFLNWKNNSNDDTPDCVTLGYEWQAFDYSRRVFRKLIKPKGGFFVGPSVEGIMAIGTVRFISDAGAPREAVINGYRYKLSVHPGATPKNMRTFFPELIAPV